MHTSRIVARARLLMGALTLAAQARAGDACQPLLGAMIRLRWDVSILRTRNRPRWRADSGRIALAVQETRQARMVMTSTSRLAMTAALTLGALTSCSKSGPQESGAVASGRSQPATVAASPANAGNACERHLLSAADAAGILSEPITGTKPLKGDPQTCYFITASEAQGGPRLMVSIRPGLGRVTVKAWADGSMPVKGIPLGGVGDSAVWVSETNEVNAQKNDLLCNIGVHGVSRELLREPAEEQRKVGALCNKIFAADTH